MKILFLLYLFLLFTYKISTGQNYREIKDTTFINLLIKQGQLHITEDADTSIIIFKKAMSLSYELKFESGYIRSGFLLSKVYKQKGFFYDALKTIDYLIKYAKSNNNIILKGQCLYSMGEINRAAFYSDKALAYLFEALVIFKKNQNKSEQAKCYNRIAAVFFEKKMMEKAEAYADSSNTIAIPLNQHFLISSNEELLGAVYRRTNQYEQALKKLESALKWIMLSNDSTDVPNILNNFAYTYLEMKNFDKAIEYANKSFRISVNKDILVYTSNAAQILSDCYRAKNQLEKAYNYLRFRDSLSYKSFMNDRNKIIMDLNEKYEAGKKEKERILLQKENEIKNNTIKNQNYLFLLSLLILIIILTGSLIIYKGKQKLAISNKQLEFKREKITEQNKQITIAFEKLKELESFKESMTGMIVHDLKNPLNTIINPASYLNETQKLESVKQAGYHMLNLVSNILDVQKYESHKMILSKKYIQLAFISIEAKNQVSLLLEQKNIILIDNINPQIYITADTEVVIRVFVNLLTNAIKHSPSNSEIKIYSDYYDNNVKIFFEDFGEGIPHDQQELVFDKFSQVIAKKSGLARSTGLGLAFCKLAVEAHGGTIAITEKNGPGSIFTINTPAVDSENSSDLITNFTKNISTDITFSEEEKNNLFLIIEELKTFKIFEISKIRNTLFKNSHNATPSVKTWINKINTAVYSGNEKLYEELLSNL